MISSTDILQWFLVATPRWAYRSSATSNGKDTSLLPVSLPQRLQIYWNDRATVSFEPWYWILLRYALFQSRSPPYSIYTDRNNTSFPAFTIFGPVPTIPIECTRGSLLISSLASIYTRRRLAPLASRPGPPRSL